MNNIFLVFLVIGNVAGCKQATIDPCKAELGIYLDSIKFLPPKVKEGLVAKYLPRHKDCQSLFYNFFIDAAYELSEEKRAEVRSYLLTSFFPKSKDDKHRMLSLYSATESNYDLLKDHKLIDYSLIDEFRQLDFRKMSDIGFYYFNPRRKLNPYILLANSGDETASQKLNQLIEQRYKVLTDTLMYLEDYGEEGQLGLLHSFLNSFLREFQGFYSVDYTKYSFQFLDLQYDLNKIFQIHDVGILTTTGYYRKRCIHRNLLYSTSFRKKWYEIFSEYAYTYEGKDMDKLQEFIAQFKVEAMEQLARLTDRKNGTTDE